jgi:hypothetical protein
MTTPEPSRSVRIPADVDREDRVVANLTARQVALLATAATILYGLETVLARWVTPIAALVAVLPPGIAAAAVILGTRGGVSLDRLLVAAARQHRQPRIRITATDEVDDPDERSDGSDARPGRVPAWISMNARTPSGRRPRDNPLATFGPDPVLPIRAVAENPASAAGVVDLGGDGLAVLCVASTVNFALRTGMEQEALVACFGRYLHSLSTPVQILIRTQPLDLSDRVAEIREHAGSLAHPALQAAAFEHADYLAELATQTDLLHRQVLLVLREPLTRASRERRSRSDSAAPTRLARRVSEAAQLMAPTGIVITPLSAAECAAVMASQCRPDTLISRPSEMFNRDAVVTASLGLSGRSALLDADGTEAEALVPGRGWRR